MSTKEVQSWLEQHPAFRDRSRGFRYFTSILFLVNILTLLFFWINRMLG
ncbi:hypothetical protein [Flaviaesturariibacter terrae]